MDVELQVTWRTRTHDSSRRHIVRDTSTFKQKAKAFLFSLFMCVLSVCTGPEFVWLHMYIVVVVYSLHYSDDFFFLLWPTAIQMLKR